MPDITRGHTFVNGEVVEAQSLNELVSNAVIQPSLINEKVLKDPAAMSDRILIEDSGTLKGITIQQIVDLVSPIIRGQAVPVGTVCDFAGGSEPENWMFCYGQEIDMDIYADLFAVIGSYYGGNGTTTFRLPDYRGVVLAGRNDMGGTSNAILTTVIDGHSMNAFGGEEVHALGIEEVPIHGHPLSTNIYPVSNENAGYGLTATSAFAGRVIITAPSSGIQPSTAGSIQAHTNIQPTRITNKIIKVLNV